MNRCHDDCKGCNGWNKWTWNFGDSALDTPYPEVASLQILTTYIYMYVQVLVKKINKHSGQDNKMGAGVSPDSGL